MKHLLIDVGNSRFKWAVSEAGQLSPGGTFVYSDASIRSQLAEFWITLCQQHGRFEKIIIANVANKHTQTSVNQWLQDADVLSIVKVAASVSAYGVRNSYQKPEKLGVDRWLGLIAARHYYSGASCIIDCGTALTIDLLAADGQHLGGVIVPGLAMMRNRVVADIENVSPQEESLPSLLGVDTHGALYSGARAATIGAIEYILQSIHDDLCIKPTCVITGGDALNFLDDLRGTFYHEPEWVFKGLAIIGNDQGSVDVSSN